MYKIQENPIQIKTLTVGKSKFTKLVFNQVLSSRPFNKNLEFTGTSIYGFVNTDNTRYLLWVKDNDIRKYDLANIIHISKLDVNSRPDYINEKVLEKNGIFVGQYEFSSKYLWLGLNDEDEKRLSTMIENAKKLLNFLNNHQVYL